MPAAHALTVGKPPVAASPRGRGAQRGTHTDVLRLQRLAGNRAVCAIQRIAIDLDPDRIARQLEESRRALRTAARVAEDFIEEATDQSIRTKPGGKVSENWIRKRLGEIADAGGTSPEAIERAAKAGEMLDEIDRLRKEVGELKDRLEGVRPTPQRPYGAKKAEKEAKHRERLKNKGKKGGGGGGGAGQAAGKAEGQAATHVPDVKTSTVTKVEEAAAETLVKSEAKLGSRIAKGAGRMGLSMLLPGPEDAFVMMAEFANSIEEAKGMIRDGYTRRGVACGIAAGIMDLDWEWVREHLWLHYASPEMTDRVLGAVGLAERSFNDGLERGHKYGSGHGPNAKERIRGEALAALAARGYEPDEEEPSTDTVVRVARTLMPMAQAFLAKSAANKKAREQREDLERRRRRDEVRGNVGNKF